MTVGARVAAVLCTVYSLQADDGEAWLLCSTKNFMSESMPDLRGKEMFEVRLGPPRSANARPIDAA
jgi:hypothetical protein